MFIEAAEAPELNPIVGVQGHGYAWAGYVALRLLAAEAPRRLEAIERAGPDAWARWAATVALAEPYHDAPEEQDAHAALVRCARAAAPDVVDAAVLRALERALAADPWQVPRRALVATAATPLGRAVLARALETLERDLGAAASEEASNDAPAAMPEVGTATEPVPEANEAADTSAQAERDRRAQARDARRPALVDVLVALLEGDSTDARETLRRVLQEFATSVRLDVASMLASADRERALVAAHALLGAAADRAGDSAWDYVRPLIQAAPPFAQTLFLRMTRYREVSARSFRERLVVRGVGDLFVAPARAFRYETNPQHPGVYTPGARDNVMTRWYSRASRGARQLTAGGVICAGNGGKRRTHTQALSRHWRARSSRRRSTVSDPSAAPGHLR